MKQYLRVCKKLNVDAKNVCLPLFAILMLQMNAKAQDRQLVYDIMREGDVIGTINFEERINKKRFLLPNSDVKTRFIFSFSDYCKEAAAYEDGVMVYSFFYQKQNGKDKANKETIASGNSYKLTDNGVSKVFGCNPIRYNMLLLYCAIPENITKVYSDNYQKLLDLKKVDEHKYRLTLPDGNYNYYTYRDGVCCKVDVERTFFTL